MQSASAYVAASRDLWLSGGRRRGRSLRQANGTAFPCTDRCFLAVAGSHYLRFACCLATMLLFMAPTQPRRRPPSGGPALPTVAPTIQSRRIPSIPSAATQRQRRGHPVAVHQLNCGACVLVALHCRRFAHKPRQTDRQTDRQTGRQADRRISTSVFINYDNAWILTTCESATCCRCISGV